MKILNTIQELWDYCEFCPICQKSSRMVFVSVGPDSSFELVSIEKSVGFLTINCKYRFRRNIYYVSYIIDLYQNIFNINSGHSLISDQTTVDNDKVKRANFYFYINSDCSNCSSASSLDLEFDLKNKTISNIAVEREYVYLEHDSGHFNITTFYDQDYILISQDDGSKGIKIPFLNLDFTNKAKVINRIKTLILFS